MLKSATILCLATAMTVATVAPSLARGGNSSSLTTGGNRAWGASPNQNPNDYPNCMMWSQRDRNYVWICGPPYPAGMRHR